MGRKKKNSGEAKTVKHKYITPVEETVTVEVPGIGEVETNVKVFQVEYRDLGPVIVADRKSAEEEVKRLRAEWKAANQPKTKTKGGRALDAAVRALYRAMDNAEDFDDRSIVRIENAIDLLENLIN
jgi:hypothetical protein